MLRQLEQILSYISLQDGISYVTEYKKINISSGKMDQMLLTCPESLSQDKISLCDIARFLIFTARDGRTSRTKGALSLSKITEFVTVQCCQKNPETRVCRRGFQIIIPLPWICFTCSYRKHKQY